MSILIQRVKVVGLLGGAVVCGGVAIYIYYQLYKKDDENDEASANLPPRLELSKVEITIPQHAVGVVIGRHGANIKQIQLLTSTSINITNTNTNERRCTIMGQLENVQRAKDLIFNSIEEIPVTESKHMFVPCQALGRIIGRNGYTISTIQRETGAKVNIVDDFNGNVLSEGQTEESRKIVLKGTLEQIKAAELSILHKVEEDQELRQKIERSASKISQRSKTKTKQNGLESSDLRCSKREEPFLHPISSKTYNEVFVSAVHSATHFWVQIIGSKTVDLDAMVSQMSEFYEDPNNAELYLPDRILVDDIVAAKFPHDDMWYRGRILDTGEEETAMRDVYFVDFGDTDLVETKDIRELRTDFLTLSFQAVECYLANIDPESAISSESLQAFECLTHATLWKPVMARVLGYKQEEADTIPFVKIVDTSGTQDVDVAEDLVKRRLASWADDRLTDRSSSLASLSEALSI